MIERKTIFSQCRRYRYVLWREWPAVQSEIFEGVKGKRLTDYVQFIGLNPSTADETIDDPTVRRCIDFAKAWGFGALCMTNAFAWRDTSPEEMKKAQYPIAELDVRDMLNENDRWINRIAIDASLIVLAWGKDGAHMDRGTSVLGVMPKGRQVYCLGVNNDGTPKHPLYLRKDLTPIPYLPNQTIDAR